MDGFASPSISPARPGWGVVRWVEAALFTALMGITLVGIPIMPSPGLDSSWQVMLIHAHAAGLQFGKDVIFTWGPWGFLCNPYHMGDTAAVPILLWQTVGQFAIAAALVFLTRDLVSWRRWAFALVFIGVHWMFLDTGYFTVISLAVLQGLMAREATLRQRILWAVALGFLAQLKFTYLVLCGVGIAASAVLITLRQSLWDAAAVIVGFGASVLGFWMAGGQDIEGLYPYIRRGLEVSSGYADAMGAEEVWPVFLWGGTGAILVAWFLLASWRRIPERSAAWCQCGFVAFLFYVMWKEGFIRADGHVFGFFSLVLILVPVLPGVFFPGRRLHAFDLVVPVLAFGLGFVEPGIYSKVTRIVKERQYGNSHGLARIGSRIQIMKNEWELASARAELPAIKAAVGDHPVDVLTVDMASALMNGLNLRARPVFQSYSAYTPGLEGWNLRFYQSSKAPDYVLWNPQLIDGRYPGQDDAMIVQAGAGHLVPVLREGGFTLYRRTSAFSGWPMERRELLRRAVKLAEWVDVPRQPAAVGLALLPRPTAIGRLRSLLYRPAALFIEGTDSRGAAHTWRILPRVAEAGFVLSPILDSPAEIEAYFKGEASRTLASFRLVAIPGQEEFWSKSEVVLFSIPGIPLHGADASH
jgi:hypothetical protein